MLWPQIMDQKAVSRMPDLHPRLLLRSPSGVVALSFGTGLLPGWRGTWGALVGVLLAAPLGFVPEYLQAFAVILAVGGGVHACGTAGRLLHCPDSSHIVWDETVGMMIVALALQQSLLWLCVGFVAFRAADILKPWPIGWVDRRMQNGWGVMGDDLLAAAYALSVALLIRLAAHSASWSLP